MNTSNIKLKRTVLAPSFLWVLTMGFFAAALSVLVSCGGGGDRDGSAPPPNTAPTVPTLTGPTDRSLCISNVVTLTWNASSDAQNDAIVYQVQIATDNQFTQVVNSGSSSSLNYTVTLEKGKAYYWRVRATDSKSASSDYSSVFSFYTEANATVNHLPFMPELIRPTENSAVNPATVNLEWDASDVDVSDVLTYDLYWGTNRSSLSSSKLNHTTKTHQLTALQASTVYYWRVVVKDNRGGETQGQIWSFRTN